MKTTASSKVVELTEISATTFVETLRCIGGDDGFDKGLLQLRGLPFDRSVYSIARILWDMWKSRPNSENEAWFVAIGPGKTLSGIAPLPLELKSSWRDQEILNRYYQRIDPDVNWQDTVVFRITDRRIQFGNPGQACFWGLYCYLRRVSAELNQVEIVKK